MKKHMNDAAHNLHLDQHRAGLVRQVFESYYKESGYLRKETIVRVYYVTGEYTDTSTIETICHVK